MRALVVRIVFIIVALLVARAAGGAVMLALAILAGLVLVVAAVRLHPRRGCLECGGRGRRYSRVLPWYFRLCANCGGNGRVLHRGVQWVGSPRHRVEYRASQEAAKGHSRFYERTR